MGLVVKTQLDPEWVQLCRLTVMISIGQQLKDWRSRHRLGKQEAANALGITVRTLDAIESGQSVDGRVRQLLLEKLSRPPHSGLRPPETPFQR